MPTDKGDPGEKIWPKFSSGAEISRKMKSEEKDFGLGYKTAGLPWWLSGKESSCQYRRQDPGSIPGSGRSPLEKETHSKGRKPTPVFLPGKSHGQRSLAGYRPWGRRKVRQN